MNEIDDLFRTYLATLPEPTADVATQVARTAVAGTVDPEADRRGRKLRGLAVAVGGLGVAGLVAVLGILFVQAPGSSGISATAGEARVAWGLTAEVTVQGAQPGEPTEFEMRRVVDALVARARLRDVGGLQITQTGPRELRLSVPGATTVLDLREFTSFTSVDLVNLDTSLIATGSTLRDLAAAANALPGPKTRFAVQTGGIAEVVETRVAADERLRSLGAEEGTILPLPANVLIVDRPSKGTPTVLLIKDEPVVASMVWNRASFVGARFQLDAHDADQQAAREAIRAVAASRPTLAVIGRQGPGRGYEYGASERFEVTPTGVALTEFDENSDDHAVFDRGEPLVDATLSIGTLAPYGVAEPPAGDRNISPPSAISGPDVTVAEYGPDPSRARRTVAVEEGSVVRAATASLGERTWTVWAGRTTEGREASWTSGGDDDAQFGNSNCPVGAGVPILRSCGLLGIGKEQLLFGRARAEVTDVQGRFADGTVVEGVAENGWFLIPFRFRGVEGAGITVVARDASGRVIAELTPNGVIVRR